MDKLNLPYLKAASARAYSFYQIPKLLIDNESFSSLDGWALILYGIMLNRASLSAENSNEFTDENGNLYIIYTVEEAMQQCKKGNKFIIKTLNQLEETGLIERKRRGLGKPSITYVKDFSVVELEHFKKCHKDTSRDVIRTRQEVLNEHTSNNDLNNTILNPILSNQSKVVVTLLNDYDEIREDVSRQIDFKLLKEDMPYEDMVDDILEIMVEVIASQKEYYKISGENIPIFEFQKRIRKIGKEDIELLLERFNQQKNSIKNFKAYLLKSLYDLPTTTNAYWTNKVRADGLASYSRKDVKN